MGCRVGVRCDCGRGYAQGVGAGPGRRLRRIRAGAAVRRHVAERAVGVGQQELHFSFCYILIIWPRRWLTSVPASPSTARDASSVVCIATPFICSPPPPPPALDLITLLHRRL